jgi:hypothetical protein
LERFVVSTGRAGSTLLSKPPDVVLDGLADSVGWVRRTILGTQGWRDRFLGRGSGPNDLFPPAPEPGGPPQILYGGAHTLLEPEQALVIEFTPQARTWNVNWHHLPWGESADVLRQQTSLNHTQAAIDGDGRVRIVIAGRDPGVANWIDTAGRREGILLYRWMWSEDAPVPSGTVVPVDDILGVLPSDTALVDTDGRAAQLAHRRAHLARRY